MMSFAISALVSVSNAKALEELNHKLDRSKKDADLLKKQMEKSKGKCQKTVSIL